MIVYSSQAIRDLKRTCFAGVNYECLLVSSAGFTEISSVLLEKVGKHNEQKVFYCPSSSVFNP
jgi:hypothetical protein